MTSCYLIFPLGKFLATMLCSFMQSELSFLESRSFVGEVLFLTLCGSHASDGFFEKCYLGFSFELAA